MAGYSGGRIKRIKIHNFMTYDNVELYPKKGLNLIVGLNGSGKSSIMCAICLGLAGKPHFTGRATQLSDFIKHGHQEAEIEIELEACNGTSVLIQRKLREDKSEWTLNRKISNNNEVTSAVKKFNIDTSNLCQFLPQEKVVEFSRMDKKQRLENLLQAIGEPHLFDLFNQLKDLHKKVAEVAQNVKKHQSNKNSAEVENERISDEVQKQEGRVRLRSDLDEILKQKKIVIYQDLCEEVQQIKQSLAEKEAEVKNLRNERAEADALENSIISSYAKYNQSFKTCDFHRKDLMNKVTNTMNTLTNFSEQVENAKIECENKIKEKKEQQKRSCDVKKQIEGLERLLNEEKDNYHKCEEKEQLISQSLTQLQREISELYRSVEKALTDKNHVEYCLKQKENQLNSLKDEQQKKMVNLRRKDKYTYEAACWLLENRTSFKANVYLPIMLEINVSSQEYTKYVENVINFRDFIAFVCEDKGDCERLTDILKKQKRLPVNIVMAPDAPMSNYKSPHLSHEHRKYGLQHFIIDLFSAPEPIMRYLCACYNVHRIPVATSAVSPNCIEFIVQNFPVFFSDNTRISGKRSRYGNKNLSVKRDIVTAQNFLVNSNDERQNEVEQQCHALRQEYEHKLTILEGCKAQFAEKEKNQEKLRDEMKSLQDKKKDFERTKVRYLQKKKYQSQMSVVFNETKEKELLRKRILSINELRNNTFGEQNSMLHDYSEAVKKIVTLELAMNSCSKSLKLMKDSNEDIHEKVNSAEREFQVLKQKKKERKTVGKVLYEEITRLGEEYVLLIEGPTIELLQGLSLDEIELKINHIQAQLNLNEDNERVVIEYNKRKERIESIQSQINELNVSLDELNEAIREKKQEWLKPLLTHIANINKKFSHYFKQLSCAGEISLDIPENPDDFTKYGLRISLKFHDEEASLCELSQTHHSGGECSVAAIVFILSLQELTEVPFRCIDEINQGMDSINERKIYQLIADSVEDDRCSQYFLLTPKLLNDLHYPKDVAVHIIFNSPFLNMKLDVRKHLEIEESLRN